VEHFEELADVIDSTIRTIAARPVFPTPNIDKLMRRKNQKRIPEKRLKLFSSDLWIWKAFFQNNQKLAQRRHGK